MVRINTSKSDSDTDKKLRVLERKIRKVYRQAQKELDEKYDQYLNGWDEVVDGKAVHHQGFYERKANEFTAYQNGEYTDEQWKSWLQAQIGRGKRWESLRDDMAARLTYANQIASGYINDDLPDVYSVNYNYTAYQIECNTSITAFNVIPPATVRQLIENDEIVLPKTKVNVPKDQRWNRKKLQGALIQGILQGDSVWDIAGRFQQVTNMNRVSALRNARTTFTAYQNAGKQDVFDQCEKLGTKLEKEWISAHDDRTRESHLALDGVRVENDKKFPNGLMHPGDMLGPPQEVYNCRCAMRAILPGINDERRTDNTVESYNEWYERKEYEKHTRILSKGVKTSKSNKSESYIFITERAKDDEIEYNPVKKLGRNLTENEIIERLSGVDNTEGSCSSLAFAYCGNKAGYDVLDYRGGESCDLFSREKTINKIALLPGVESFVETGRDEIKTVYSILKKVKRSDIGKEYYFSAGKHAAIIRKTENGFDYLDMQIKNNGNYGYNRMTKDTIKYRFGCKRSKIILGKKVDSIVVLIDVDSLCTSKEFIDILGYINTV